MKGFLQVFGAMIKSFFDLSKISRESRFLSLTTILMLFLGTFQYAREIYIGMYYPMYYLLNAESIKPALGLFQKIVPFSLSNPLLWIKGFNLVFHISLIIAFVAFYYRDWRYVKWTIVFLGSTIGGGVVINLLGRALGYAGVTQLGRNFFDLFISPFALAFLIPAFTLQQRIDQSEKKSSKK